MVCVTTYILYSIWMVFLSLLLYFLLYSTTLHHQQWKWEIILLLLRISVKLKVGWSSDKFHFDKISKRSEGKCLRGKSWQGHCVLLDCSFLWPHIVFMSFLLLKVHKETFTGIAMTFSTSFSLIYPLHKSSTSSCFLPSAHQLLRHHVSLLLPLQCPGCITAPSPSNGFPMLRPTCMPRGHVWVTSLCMLFRNALILSVIALIPSDSLYTKQHCATLTRLSCYAFKPIKTVTVIMLHPNTVKIQKLFFSFCNWAIHGYFTAPEGAKHNESGVPDRRSVQTLLSLSYFISILIICEISYSGWFPVFCGSMHLSIVDFNDKCV